MVASGHKLLCTQKITNLRIRLGDGYELQDEFYVVNMGDYDIVLGMTWMASLREFTLNMERVEMRLCGIDLTPSTSYHPQTDGQIDIVNKWVEGYLRNYVTTQQRAWVRWLHMGEYCYNTTYHMSIKMTPFMALYGYEAPSFMDLVLGDSRVPKAKDSLQDSQDILRALKENIQQAQNQ
ncbi:uncharacterized protein LOC131874407 [Cryptomeria japonica]|uniref:uncharacterized protein LOC131874407 n=1 Tax=Cryptomeria japonica TaxID=3369 RepID=UPI0027DA17DB|nr:uncharacterized protein LOC131874407 [Cryptomeria japonica]